MRFIKTKGVQGDEALPQRSQTEGGPKTVAKKSLFSRTKATESEAVEVSFSEARPEESALMHVSEGEVSSPSVKRKGFLGFGVRKEPSAHSDTKPEATEEELSQKEKKSLFSLLAKKAPKQEDGRQSESSSNEKGSKKKSKTEKAEKPVKAQSGAVYLSTELENGTVILWELSSKGLKQIPAIPKGKVAYSFSDQDYRFAVDGTLSSAKATGVALAEIGETVGIVNLSKRAGSVHATRMSRINETAYALSPGSQLFENGFKTKDEGGSIVVGALLKDQTDGQSLLILQHLGANLEAGRIQLTLNPENIEYIVGQFMTREKVVRGNVKTLLYTNDELISLTKSAINYPSALTWNGISVAKIKALVLLSTSLTCAASVAYAAMNYQESTTLSAKLAQKQSATEQAKQEKLQLLSQARESIVAGMQMDVNKLFSTATQVHTPGAVVEVKANADEFEYSLSIGAYAKDGDGKSPTALPQVNALLEAPTPEGCERTAQTTTNQGDEYEVKFTCSVERSGFSRYFN